MLSQYKLPNLLADFNYVFDGICSGADLDQKREERDKKTAPERYGYRDICYC